MDAIMYLIVGVSLGKTLVFLGSIAKGKICAVPKGHKMDHIGRCPDMGSRCSKGLDPLAV